MNRRRGFTLIELLVAITIMVTLLVLAVVSLRSSNIAARDKDREAKAASIAIYLEGLYDSGAEDIYATLDLPKGQYPYAGLIANSCDSTCTSGTGDYSTNTAKLEALFSLDNFDLDTLKAPDQTTYSLVVADSATPADPTTDTFVYQPITYTGAGSDTAALCNLSGDECRAFNLFYKTEADQVVHKITSKRQ